MVRRHLHWLASDEDEDGQPKAPLLEIIARPVCGGRHTSNVYVLRVPWAEPEAVRAELAELKYVPAEVLGGVGSTGATQGGGTGATQEPLTKNLDRETPLPPTGEQPQGGVSESPGPGAGSP